MHNVCYYLVNLHEILMGTRLETVGPVEDAHDTQLTVWVPVI